MKHYYRLLLFLLFGSALIGIVLAKQAYAQSGWQECNIDSTTFNVEKCRTHAEQFKKSRGPHGQPDESWYSWASSAPFPLSFDTACGVAPQSIDCRSVGTVPLVCPSGSEFLFTTGGRLSSSTVLHFGGEVTVAGGDWRSEKEDSIFVARSDQKPSRPLTIEFAQPVTMQTVFMYDNDTETTNTPWSINGVSLPETKDNKWGTMNFNKTSNQLNFESGGNMVHFNVCIKKLTTTPRPSISPTRTLTPTTRPTGTLTLTPPAGGNGRGFLFNPSQVTKNVGDTFDVLVTVDTKTEQVFGAEAHVKYDPSILSLSKVTEGNFFPAVLSTNNTGSSSIRGIVAEPADYRTGTGNFATLTFTVIQNGATTVTFYCDPSAYNSSKLVKNDINASNVIECQANNTLTVQVGDGQQISPTSSNSASPTQKPSTNLPGKDRAKILAAIILLIFVLLIILIGI